MNRALLPIVAGQGMWVCATTRMAAPATGPTTGTVGDPSRETLRVGVLGDSTAAGCGVDTHDDGFAGCLARALAARSGRTVTWEVVGEFGATSRRVRYRLLPRLGDNLDIAVLLAGGNDVLARRSPHQWGDDLAAIVDQLSANAKNVAVIGTPPFAAFPALPATLRRYLSERAAALDEVSRRVCATRPRTAWITPSEVPPPAYFCADRFHPSAAGYRRWAELIADHIPV